MIPRYPIYIPSKNRYDCCLTADFLIKDKVPFKLVIEPQELDLYSNKYGKENILVLPYNNSSEGVITARNWIWEHSLKNGFKRHWQIDDNIRQMRRTNKGFRIGINAGIALGIIEDFTDRYENVGISGPNYSMFTVTHNKPNLKPFIKNCHIYSCMLILNSLPFRWRGRWNEDVDLCLQTLSHKYCTIQTRAFIIDKQRTMTMKGGNSDDYKYKDIRLKGTKILMKRWPKVVTLTNKFGRPHFKIRKNWKDFNDIPLIRRKDIDWEKIKKQTYDIPLKVVQPIKSKRLRQLLNKDVV